MTMTAPVPAPPTHTNTATSARLALWAADRWERESVAVDASLRLTVLPSRGAVYAEPRVRAAWKPVTTVVLAASGGLYRQFVHQCDYSTLNAGELVPSTRFWLPIDESATPAERCTRRWTSIGNSVRLGHLLRASIRSA